MNGVDTEKEPWATHQIQRDNSIVKRKDKSNARSQMLPLNLYNII